MSPSDIQIMQELYYRQGGRVQDLATYDPLKKPIKTTGNLEAADLPVVMKPEEFGLQGLKPSDSKEDQQAQKDKRYPLPPPIQTRTTRSEPHIPGIEVLGVPLDDGGDDWRGSSGSMYAMTATPRIPLSPTPARSPLLLGPNDGNVTVMKTGEMIRNRGYSFSQSRGARSVIIGYLNSPSAATPMIEETLPIPQPSPFIRTNTAPS
jgi:hypothetical protein